jgi:large subunit ribosomal protein L15
MLQVHTISAARGAKHRTKRIGRGNASGHGTSSTRGGKGQTARSGGSRGLKNLGFRRLMQSAPKLRGFKSLQTRPVTVYLTDLEKHFAIGDTVDLATLKTKKIVSLNIATVKLVDSGTLTKKLIVVIPCSKGAVEKIKAVGGEVK